MVTADHVVKSPHDWLFPPVCDQLCPGDAAITADACRRGRAGNANMGGYHMMASQQSAGELWQSFVCSVIAKGLAFQIFSQDGW